jgi:hypothetical protein
MKIRSGSLTAAHYNYLGILCVPFAESQTTVLSVSFGELKSQNSQINA